MNTADSPARPGLEGSSSIYATGEDHLRIRSFNSAAGVTLAIEGRMLLPNGCIVPIADRHVPNTDRTEQTSFVGLAEGYLQTLTIRASGGTPRRGQCYVLVDFVRGRSTAVQLVGCLVAGYATDTGRLAWPGSPISDSADGPGVIRTIVGTNPAAGVEIVETVPTNARWRLKTFNYTLVASGAAANRRPVLTIDDGANILWQSFSNVAQTAGQTAIYRAGIGTPFLLYDTLAYHLPLPVDLPLQGGYRIRTVTAAIDAGDDYAAPIYTVEEWIED